MLMQHISTLAIIEVCHGTSNAGPSTIEIPIMVWRRACGNTRPNDVIESIVLSSYVRARGKASDVSRNHPTTILLRSRYRVRSTSLVATAVVCCTVSVFLPHFVDPKIFQSNLFSMCMALVVSTNYYTVRVSAFEL